MGLVGTARVATRTIDCQHCNLALPNSRASLPERQRTAFAIMIEGLGGDRAIGVYNAGGPADLVVAHGNHAPERRHAAGQETMVREKIFKRCGWPDDHQVAGRDGVRFSTP